jgi:hypothetical protein
MIGHAELYDRSRVVPFVGYSVVTVAALLPVSGVLGLAVLGTDFYLGHTGKSFGPELAFLFLGPILVLLALASGGLLSRIWSAPGATGDLDLSAIPEVTGGAACAVFAIGIDALLWIVVRTELHGTGSVLQAAAISAGPSALLVPAAIAAAITPSRQLKDADRIRPAGRDALLVTLCCVGVPYLAVLAVLWTNVANGPSTYGPASGGHIALLAGMTALPAIVTVFASRGRAAHWGMLVLAATVATSSVGWIGGVITSPPDLAALHATVILLCGPALVATAASGIWAARATRGRIRLQKGDLPVSAFPWARTFALLAAMLVSALAGVAVAPIFASVAPVAVLAGNSAGAVATTLAISLTARPHQPRARKSA